MNTIVNERFIERLNGTLGLIASPNKNEADVAWSMVRQQLKEVDPRDVQFTQATGKKPRGDLFSTKNLSKTMDQHDITIQRMIPETTKLQKTITFLETKIVKNRRDAYEVKRLTAKVDSLQAQLKAATRPEVDEVLALRRELDKLQAQLAAKDQSYGLGTPGPQAMIDLVGDIQSMILTLYSKSHEVPVLSTYADQALEATAELDALYKLHGAEPPEWNRAFPFAVVDRIADVWRLVKAAPVAKPPPPPVAPVAPSATPEWFVDQLQAMNPADREFFVTDVNERLSVVAMPIRLVEPKPEEIKEPVDPPAEEVPRPKATTRRRTRNPGSPELAPRATRSKVKTEQSKKAKEIGHGVVSKVVVGHMAALDEQGRLEFIDYLNKELGEAKIPVFLKLTPTDRQDPSP